ncbi:hypothetical protein AB7M17_003537 [Bradyrhizobium sp. USDA 377]
MTALCSRFDVAIPVDREIQLGCNRDIKQSRRYPRNHYSLYGIWLVMKKKPFVPVVAVLNMKGGVGKTTLSANIFRVLFERRRAATLLLDLDPQFNLTQALFTRSVYDKLKNSGKTILPVMEPPSSVGLFDVATSSVPPPAAASLNHTFLHFTKAPTITLDVIPGDFGLVKYSLMNDSKKLDKVRERFLKFVESEKINYKVITLDCNPSSSFLTLCALHACSHILVPVTHPSPQRSGPVGQPQIPAVLEISHRAVKWGLRPPRTNRSKFRASPLCL